jgi:signal transduction histidine kinase
MCEWGIMKRAVEADTSGLRRRKIVALGASMSKFCIAVRRDSNIYEPEMLKDKLISVTPNNGSHFTMLKMVEGFLEPGHVKTTNAGSMIKRLEALRRGVERWGAGDLGARVEERGNDEIAFLAQRFNHSAERVETLVKTHKALLANASHELRSPLTRIRMSLELMTPEPPPASRTEILRSIGELDQLVDEILLASRLDARESDVGTFEPVDLTGLAAEECAQTGAELHPPAGDAPLIVLGVPKLLRRALRNLLENARRYSSGPVEVELRREAGQACVRVCDRGPGVPAAERERIFDPFYRLPGASERDGGVGLGLALVRSITLRHHGSVVCEARPDGGACFVLKLPCHQM